jgi:hypothetical protein
VQGSIFASASQHLLGGQLQQDVCSCGRGLLALIGEHNEVPEAPPQPWVQCRKDPWECSCPFSIIL